MDIEVAPETDLPDPLREAFEAAEEVVVVFDAWRTMLIVQCLLWCKA